MNSVKKEKNLVGKNILFICASNINRSPTAEIWFSIRKPLNSYKSAGSCKAACRIHGGRYVLESDLESSDRIFLMDNRNLNDLHKEYGNKYDSKIEIVGIADKYKYLDLSLLFEIIDKIQI